MIKKVIFFLFFFFSFSFSFADLIFKTDLKSTIYQGYPGVTYNNGGHQLTTDGLKLSNIDSYFSITPGTGLNLLNSGTGLSVSFLFSGTFDQLRNTWSNGRNLFYWGNSQTCGSTYSNRLRLSKVNTWSLWTQFSSNYYEGYYNTSLSYDNFTGNTLVTFIQFSGNPPIGRSKNELRFNKVLVWTNSSSQVTYSWTPCTSNLGLLYNNILFGPPSFGEYYIKSLNIYNNPIDLVEINNILNPCADDCQTSTIQFQSLCEDPDGCICEDNNELDYGESCCRDDCEQPDINYFESCDDYDGCACENGSVTALNELCYPGSLFPSGYEDPILGCKKVIFSNTVQFDNNFLTGCSSLDYNNINLGTVYNDDVFLGSNDCFIINSELVNTSIGYFDGSYSNNDGINLGNITAQVDIDGYNSLINNVFGGVNTKIKFTYSGLNMQVVSNTSSIRSIDGDNYNYYGAAGNNLVCTGGNYDFYNHLLQTSFIYDQNLSGLSKKYYAWIDNGYINIYGYVIYQGINSKLLIPFYGKYFLGDIEEVRRLQEEDKALQSQELSNLGPEFAGVFACDTDGNGTSSVLEITKCPFTIAFNVVQTSANGMLELGKTFLVFTKIGSTSNCNVIDYSGNNNLLNSFANIEATNPVALKIWNLFKYGIYLVILGFTFLIIIKQD